MRNWKRDMRSLERRRRGAVLVEFALIIPMLAGIIALTFFFGRAMMNQQHVRISSRYTTWRQVRAGQAVGAEDLNTQFFNEGGADIEIHRGVGPDDTLDDLVTRAGDTNEWAHALAENTVTGGWPRGATARVAAAFPSDVALWRQFQGQMHGRHGRDGVEWRRGEVSYLQAIRDQFLQELDQTVSGIPDQTLQGNLRALYLQRW